MFAQYILEVAKTNNPTSCTMSAATLSSPTTSTSTTLSMRLFPTRTTGTPTSAFPTSDARIAGFLTHSRTTSPCCQKKTKQSAWMVSLTLLSSTASQTQSPRTSTSGLSGTWVSESLTCSCVLTTTRCGLCLPQRYDQKEVRFWEQTLTPIRCNANGSVSVSPLRMSRLL